jgi:hypothetical protein
MHCGETEKEFEDTKWVIRIRKSKDRQHNGQKKKDKRTNNDLQNITYKTTDMFTCGLLFWSGTKQTTILSSNINLIYS